eukprot:gene4120-5874_t
MDIDFGDEEAMIKLAIQESLKNNIKEKDDNQMTPQQLAFFTDQDWNNSAPKIDDIARTKPNSSNSNNKGINYSNKPSNGNVKVSNNQPFAFDPLSTIFGKPHVSSKADLICNGCKTTCSIFQGYINVMEKVYHKSCFKCQGCFEMIDGSFVEHDNMPYHFECKTELFNPKCSVCSNSISGSYYCHPFIESEKYCITHENRNSCFSCRRKEPLEGTKKESFIDLPDGRFLCFDCSCSIIVDSSEAVLIYQEVVNFMETSLGFQIPEHMRDVPVLAVDIQSLNENRVRNSSHGETITRGLTLSSRGEIRHMHSGSLIYDATRGTYVSNNVPSVHKIEEVRDVTAILVLYGLPRDLTASIIAHEAMHAWLKLSKHIPFHLPQKLEEGLCQVVSFKYLEFVTSRRFSNSSNSLSDKEFEALQKEELLCAYYRQQIQLDTSEVYGDGYRDANKCVETLGLDVVLDYIKSTTCLPCV